MAPGGEHLALLGDSRLCINSLKGDAILSKNGDGECVLGDELHALQLKPMTASNIAATNTADRSMFRQDAVGITAAIAPLALVIGIAAMSMPAAEAGYTT